MNKIIVLALFVVSMNSYAVVPSFNVDPYSHRYTAEQFFDGGASIAGDMSFSGLSDVSGDALCINGSDVMGTCAAAVFTTSVSSPILLSPATGSADDITIKPAGTTMMTIAEAGNVTIANDLIVSGNDITAKTMSSAASGGADDMTFSPAGVLGMTLAETTNNLTVVGDITASGADVNSTNFNGSNFKSPATGGADNISVMPAGVAVLNANEAGDVQLMKVVTSHAACAAAGDRGRIELYDNGADKVSFCGCWQSGAGTYAWVALHTGGAC